MIAGAVNPGRGSGMIIVNDRHRGRGAAAAAFLVEEPDLLEEFPMDGILAVTDVNDAVKARVLEEGNVDIHGVILGNLEIKNVFSK